MLVNGNNVPSTASSQKKVGSHHNRLGDHHDKGEEKPDHDGSSKDYVNMDKDMGKEGMMGKEGYGPPGEEPGADGWCSCGSGKEGEGMGTKPEGSEHPKPDG